MNFVRPFVKYAIFRELCDRMRFEVDCAKSHHRVISEGLPMGKLFTVPTEDYNATKLQILAIIFSSLYTCTCRFTCIACVISGESDKSSSWVQCKVSGGI